VLAASLKTTALAVVFVTSDRTVEKSDVVCSCESSCEVSPNVDDSEVRVTLEPLVDTDSGAPVNASDATSVGCESTVVSETCE